MSHQPPTSDEGPALLEVAYVMRSPGSASEAISRLLEVGIGSTRSEDAHDGKVVIVRVFIERWRLSQVRRLMRQCDPDVQERIAQ